jgi:hypothetical protein
MSVVQLPATQSAFRRIDRGRVHWYEEVPSGKRISGVTGILGDGVPKPGLINWAADTTAQYAIDNLEMLTQRPPDEALRILKGARFDDKDRAANRGTEVHKLADAWARGEDIHYPEELEGHVESYIRWRDAWKPKQELLELSVVNWTWRYAGTLDNLCMLDGHRTLVDYKTNRSGPFGEVALQLAAYGAAEFYLDVEGRPQPMPEIERYGVLWLRSDGADFYPVDVGEREWRVFLWVREVGRWLEERGGWKATDPVLGGAVLASNEVGA